MKSLHTTNARNANHKHERVRSLMTVIGIMTVILCAVVLLHEHPSMRTSARVPRLLETSKIVVADLLVEVRQVLGR